MIVDTKKDTKKETTTKKTTPKATKKVTRKTTKKAKSPKNEKKILISHFLDNLSLRERGDAECAFRSSGLWEEYIRERAGILSTPTKTIDELEKIVKKYKEDK